MRGAIGRRIAHRRRLAARAARARGAAGRAAAPQPGDADAGARSRSSKTEIAALRARIGRIPYLDPIDLRYRSRVRVPVPTAKAVMFCLMDVSGSMDEGAQGPGQALLHPAVPVPDAALREDRHRLHPPPHAGAGGRRGELLPRHRDRRHGGVERAGADGRDHPRALPARASGTSTARRPATATTGTTTAAAAASCWPTSCCRCAATSPTCRWPRKSRTCGTNTPSCCEAQPPLRDAQGDRGRADLPGVPRPVQEGRSAERHEAPCRSTLERSRCRCTTRPERATCRRRATGRSS